MIAIAKGDEPVIITYKQGKSLLKKGEKIHCFIPSVALIGADWDRKEVLKLLKDNEIQLAGKIATSMCHGIFCEGKFFEHDKEKLEQYCVAKGNY